MYKSILIIVFNVCSLLIVKAQVILTQNDTVIEINKDQKDIQLSVSFVRPLTDKCEQEVFSIPRLPLKISTKNDFNKFFQIEILASKDYLNIRSYGRGKRPAKRKCILFRRFIKLKKGEQINREVIISVDLIEELLKDKKIDQNEFYLAIHYSSIMLMGYDKTKLSCHSHQGVEYVKVPTKIVME